MPDEVDRLYRDLQARPRSKEEQQYTQRAVRKMLIKFRVRARNRVVDARPKKL